MDGGAPGTPSTAPPNGAGRIEAAAPPTTAAADRAMRAIPSGIRSACGRAKYRQLAAREGIWAGLRLAWFVGIASLRDRRLPRPDADRDL